MVKITTDTGKEVEVTAYTDLYTVFWSLLAACKNSANPTITIDHYAGQYPKVFPFVNDPKQCEEGIQMLCDALYYSGHFMNLHFFKASNFNALAHYSPIGETGAAIYHYASENGENNHNCVIHIVR